MKFYNFRLMVRPPPDFNTLHRCRRLMQQYIVDMYVKVETERLKFLRLNQKTLRAENYSDLTDALYRDDAKPANIGQKVILPSSFTGGPQYMHQRIQDAMTYVRKFGRPALFITMTCNPAWQEIKDALLPTVSAHERPDIFGPRNVCTSPWCGMGNAKQMLTAQIKVAHHQLRHLPVHPNEGQERMPSCNLIKS